MRNVQAGQAIELGLAVGLVEEGVWIEVDGRDVDRCWDDEACMEVGGRGTPQSSQTCVEEGLCPGRVRFLYAHTSHSHVPPPSLIEVPGIARALVDEDGYAFVFLPTRYRVTLGDEVNKPA